MEERRKIMGKDIERENRERGVIEEGLSDVVYHFCNIEKLGQIIDKGGIPTTARGSKGNDKRIGEGYENYVCVTRSRFSGVGYPELERTYWKGYMVRLTLNGRGINQKYISQPFNGYPNSYDKWFGVERKCSPHPNMSGMKVGKEKMQPVKMKRDMGTVTPQHYATFKRIMGGYIQRLEKDNEERRRRGLSAIKITDILPTYSELANLISQETDFTKILPKKYGEPYSEYEKVGRNGRIESHYRYRVEASDIKQVMDMDYAVIDRNIASEQEDRILLNSAILSDKYIDRIDILINPQEGGEYSVPKNVYEIINRVIERYREKVNIYTSEYEFNKIGINPGIEFISKLKEREGDILDKKAISIISYILNFITLIGYLDGKPLFYYAERLLSQMKDLGLINDKSKEKCKVEIEKTLKIKGSIYSYVQYIWRAISHSINTVRAEHPEIIRYIEEAAHTIEKEYKRNHPEKFEGRRKGSKFIELEKADIKILANFVAGISNPKGGKKKSKIPPLERFVYKGEVFKNKTLEDVLAQFPEEKRGAVYQAYRNQYRKSAGIVKEGIEKISMEDICEMVTESVRRILSENSMEELIGFHGSAANFDKFDLSFFRTGEGTGQYGFGVYVTDCQGTGEMYAEIAAYKKNYKGKRAKSIDDESKRKLRQCITKLETGANNSWMPNKFPFDGIVRDIMDFMVSNEIDKRYIEELQRCETARDLKQIAAEMKKEMVTDTEKYLYRVEIPDGPYLYWDESDADVNKRIYEYWNSKFNLDWQNKNKWGDKKLRNLFNNFGHMFEVIRGFVDSKKATPEQNEWQKELSKALHDMGYCGISVPTGRQKGRGGDGYGMNYVIFDANDIKIIGSERI